MITKDQALATAKNFVQSKGETLPGIYYGVSECMKFKSFVYFDFRLDNRENPDDVPMVDDAPKFQVDKKTGEAKTISFGQLSNLGEGK